MTIDDLQHCYLMLIQISKRDLDTQEYKAIITAIALAQVELERRKADK